MSTKGFAFKCISKGRPFQGIYERFWRQVGFSKLSIKGVPSRTSKRILLVDQNDGHSKISTKGLAFKLDVLKCPRKALPSNVFLKTGLPKTSTKDFVHKLALLSCPRKACLQGLQKECYWLTKSALLRASVPRYPRKALPSNVFLKMAFPRHPRKSLSTSWLC